MVSCLYRVNLLHYIGLFCLFGPLDYVYKLLCDVGCTTEILYPTKDELRK